MRRYESAEGVISLSGGGVLAELEELVVLDKVQVFLWVK
jgi:hypothetical protein